MEKKEINVSSSKENELKDSDLEAVNGGYEMADAVCPYCGSHIQYNIRDLFRSDYIKCSACGERINMMGG